jgi:hypothetical protein
MAEERTKLGINPIPQPNRPLDPMAYNNLPDAIPPSIRSQMPGGLPAVGGMQDGQIDPRVPMGNNSIMDLPVAPQPPSGVYGGYDIGQLAPPAPVAPSNVQGGYDLNRVGGEPEPQIAPPTAGGVPPAQVGPFAGMQSFQTPGGGSVAMPSILPDGRTAVDIQGSITGKGRTGPQGYTAEERERIRGELSGAPEDVKRRIRTGTGEAQERLAGKKIISSLTQQGMTEDEIRKAIGADTSPNMTQAEAVRKLKEVQKQKQMQTSDARTAKQSEAIAGMEERGAEGEAMNDAARFVDLERGWSGTGADPLGETLESQMTKSQKREFGRLRDKVANDRARDGDFKRMEKMLADAQLKSERSVLKRQAQDEKEALNLAGKRALTAEKNAEVNRLKSIIQQNRDRLDEKGKGKPDNKERERLIKENQGYVDQMKSFVEGAEVGAGAVQQDSNQAVIQAFMNANPGMTAQQAQAEATARGYIK